MAHKIPNIYFDARNINQWEDSVREYDEFETMAVRKGEDRWDRDEPVTLTLYVDPETGITVAGRDALRAYEEWVRHVWLG